VLVIGADIDGQMAPYNEEIRVERYKSRVGLDPEHYPVVVLAKEVEAGTLEIDLLDPVAIAANLNARYGDDGEEYGADEQGLFQWSTYNPDSKWDWYVIGGRWQGSLLLKPDAWQLRATAQYAEGQPGVFGNRGPGVDQCRKGDLDLEAMRAQAVLMARQQWAELRADQAKYPDRDMRWMYGLNPEDTEESSIAQAQVRFPLHTHAVLAEGLWREVGKLGWWGVSSDDESDRLSWGEWYEQFINGLPDEALLTIVDYHI
jgi:hypothetical protein